MVTGFTVNILLRYGDKYRLHCVLLQLSRCDFTAGHITSQAYKRRIYNCMKQMATAKKCVGAGFAASNQQPIRPRNEE